MDFVAYLVRLERKNGEAIQEFIGGRTFNSRSLLLATIGRDKEQRPVAKWPPSLGDRKPGA